jgi:hypothetical protein
LAGRHLVPEGFLSRGLLAALVAAIALGGVSCGLFEARKPTDPGTNFFPCSPLDQQDNVFTNILQAYGRGNGLSCYLTTLDESFAFHPDPTDSTEAPAGQYDGWSKTVEQQVSQNLVSGSQSFGLRYTAPYELVGSTPDSEIRRYHYEIEFEGTPGVMIPDTLFQGIAEFTIRRSSSGLWQITDWVDRRDPGGTTTRTWGYLRGAFRIGI